jgi:PAS domain-containing protein
LAAITVGSGIAAAGAALAIIIVKPTASPLHVWQLWFMSSSLGAVTVAPRLIELGAATRERLSHHELIEGWGGILALTALSVLLISLPDGPWATALPEALVFPFLVWVAVRCPPVFAAGAALVVGLTIIGSTTLNIGNFDSGKPPAHRILSAQIFVFLEAILVVLLAAVFAERRRGEKALKQVAERLQLALDGAKLGAFSADLTTGQLACDTRLAQFHAHTIPPRTINESRCFVHAEDRSRIDDAVAEAQHTGRNWRAEYRVLPPPGHPHGGETRWVAVEGSIVRNPQGLPVQLLGVTRDITDRKRTEDALAERNAQLALAGKAALVGTYAYDLKNNMIRVTDGYAAIHGLPEGTTEIPLSLWQRWRAQFRSRAARPQLGPGCSGGLSLGPVENLQCSRNPHHPRGEIAQHAAHAYLVFDAEPWPMAAGLPRPSSITGSATTAICVGPAAIVSCVMLFAKPKKQHAGP